MVFAHITSLYNVTAQDERVHWLSSGSEPAISVRAVYLELARLLLRKDSIMKKKKIPMV